MSTTIDQKVVEMRFDNKQFEQNVSTTMSSIDTLKQKLKFEGASKGLESISDSAKKVDMDTLSNNVDEVGIRFNALHVIADHVLRTITSAALNAGKRIISALTIDPLKMGFSEYETQINAVQTILANTKSKGTTLDDVNGALDELNAYADKTIYNFTEMTRNIGTFTAAGVDLDTSVSAIKGIANLAAVSGSTSQQASTAMYQLSQALSSGTVKLMDWNSVVNAGMGGQVFQDALKETARVHGIAIDELIKKEGSFRETLSHGWLSSEILTETLSKFTGDLNAEQLKTMGYTEEQIKNILEMGQTANDAATKVKTFSQLLDTLKEAAQSGWTSTWEIVVGDFEEAKALWTSVSDTIGGMLGRSAAARNELLENWKVLGGRQAIIDGIKYAFEGFMGIVKAVSEAMKEVFPPMTAERLVAISEKIRDVAKSFDAFFHVRDENGVITGTTKNFENLKRTLKGIFAVVRLVLNVLGALFKAAGKILSALGPLISGVLTITAVIFDWVTAISNVIIYTGIFENVFVGLANIIKFAISIIGNFGRAIGESFVFEAVSEGLNAFLGLIVNSADATDRFAQMGKNVKDAWINSGLYSFLMKVWEVIKAIGTGIAKVFGGLFSGIADAFGRGDWESIFDLINGLLSGGIVLALGKLVKAIVDLLGAPKSIINTFKEMLGGVTDIFDELGNTFKAFQDKLKADALKSIATAILMIVGAIVVLSFINEEALSKALAGIAMLMTMMIVMMKVMNAGSHVLKAGEVFEHMDFTSAITRMAVAILLLSAAVAIFATMDRDQMLQGIAGVGILLAELAVIQILMSKFGGGGSVKGAAWLIAMGLTMILFASSMRILATIEPDALVNSEKALVAIIGIIGLMQALQGVLGKIEGNGMLKGAAAMMIMAMSLNSLIPIILVLGLLPIETLVNAGLGLIGILGIFLTVQTMYAIFGRNNNGMIQGAAAMAIMSVSLLALSKMLLILSVIPFPLLWNAALSLIAILGTLSIVVVMYSKLGGSVGQMLAGAGAIAIISMSIGMLMPFLALISAMPHDKLQTSIGALLKILVTMGLVVTLFSKLGGSAGKMAAGAASLLIISYALTVLSGALLLLGQMNADQATVALISFAGALGIIVVAAIYLEKVMPVLVKFASVIALVGVGVLATGAGIVLLGLGFSTLALGIIEIVGALTALVGALGTVAVALVVLVAAVVEGIIRGLGAGIVALCEVLIDALPLLTDVCIELVNMVCDVLVACVPKIIDTVLILVLEVIDGLVQYIPDIVAAAVRLVTGIINALAQELPELVEAIVDVLFALIEGVINALGNADSAGLADATKNMSCITLIIAELAAMKFLAPAAMAGVIEMGIVVAELAGVLAILGGLSRIDGMNELMADGGKFLGIVGTAIGELIGGIVGGTVSGAKEGMKDLPVIGTALSGFAVNVGDFLDIAPKLADSMSALAGASIMDSLAGIFNFSGSAMDTFRDELPKLGMGLAGFSDAIGKRDMSNIGDAAEGAAGLADVFNKLPNVGGWSATLFGDKDMGKFATDLSNLGGALAGFSDNIGTRDFSNVTTAVTAASALADMSKNVPDPNGMMYWITGKTSLAQYSEDLGKLGEGISNFATNVGNLPDVTAAITVGQQLAELTQSIPNNGGIVSWFAGDQSISKFKDDLGDLGAGISNFATNAGEINSDNMTAAITAAQSIVELTNKIPNEGGVKAWFVGESSLSKFGNDLGDLGSGIQSFATNTEGITPETVKAAADAAIALSSIMDHVPNEGGVKAWLTGESSLATFGGALGDLGTGLATFATNTANVTPETVKAAADAAISLAGIMDYVPNEGGITAWFTGESSLSKFGDELGNLGTGLNEFSVNTKDVTPETVKAAADAAITLAGIMDHIPNTEGVIAWFTGEASVSKFADQLPRLGEGLAGFSKGLGDAPMDNVESAAIAGKAIAEMTSIIPKDGGIKAWFSGETSFAKFADKLPSIGSAIAGFAKGVGDADMTKVEPAANAGKTLAEMTSTVPGNSDKIVKFGENLCKFGDGMKKFINDTKGMTAETTNGATLCVNLVKDTASIDAGKIQSVTTAVKNLAKAVKNMAKDIKSDMKDAGKKAVEGYINGINDKIDDAEKKAKQLVTDSSEAASEKASSFETAGENAADGYAQGIKNHQSNAVNAALAMVNAVLTAIKNAQDSHSPSRETEKLGSFGGMGFVNGLRAYVSKAESVGYDLGDSAKNGLKDAVNRIQKAIDSDMDTQPTIRPVLDLSDVESRAGLLNSLFGTSSVGVRANLGAINSMMSSRNQNGTNADIIDAIKELREDLSNVGNTTYHIDGITYDDGSNIAEAVSTLIRAARIERRV